jgi:hypothetical protein
MLDLDSDILILSKCGIFFLKIISNLDEFWVFCFCHDTSLSSPKAYKAGFLLPMNFRQILTYPNSPDFSEKKESKLP